MIKIQTGKNKKLIKNPIKQIEMKVRKQTANGIIRLYFQEILRIIEFFFDVNEGTSYKKVVDAFLLEERYNNIAIKSQALYLMDLKKKYPDSNIKFLSDIINQTLLHKNKIDLTSSEEIKRAIFHNDNKYSLLQKLRNDIVDYDTFD